MIEGLGENFSFFAVLLICFINLFYTVTGSGNTFLRIYRKLTDEEKQCYDIRKVKVVQIIFILSWIIFDVLIFVSTKLYPNIINISIFIIWFIVELVLLIILNYTKWFLNVFCKKR